MIIKKKGYSLLAAAVCMAAVSMPTHAWRGFGGGSGAAFGARGGSAAWSHGTGVAYGPHGGSASWSDGTGVAYGGKGGSAAWSGGSGVAHGAYGGSAAWSGGTGYAHGAYGGSAAWSHPTYGYGYHPVPVPVYGYRPPVYYGSSGYSGGDVAAAGIAGLAVGAMAGAAAASRPTPAATTVVVQQPTGSAPLVLGTTLTYLPGGCMSITYSSAQYYQCGPNWFRTYFGSNGAFYQVVPAPY